MLSIRTLRHGGRGGREIADYLLRGESRYYAVSAASAYWVGRLRDRLGLGVELKEGDFLLLLDGVHPQLGIEIARGAGGRRTHGTDLTFSAPKSASILLALGCEEVRIAHRLAVRTALDFVERRLIRYRIKANGRIGWFQSHEALFAVFEHEVSREKEPQLHSHAVLLNLTWDPVSGKYRALRNDEIYVAQKAVGLIYRSALARALEAFGFAVRLRDPAEGLFEVAGVPEGLAEALSTRRRQIEAQVAAWESEAATPGLPERSCSSLRV